MSNQVLFIKIFLTSFISAVILTPIFRVIAFKTGTVAMPTRDRFHITPTPMMGGFAVFLSFFISLCVFSDLNYLLSLRLLFLAALILVVSGFYDDRKKLNPFLKLPTQIFSAFALYLVGWKVKIFPSESVNMVLTLFWVVGLINAMNFIDNIDGLAAGITVINSIFFLIVSILFYKLKSEFLQLPVSLIGACLGFLIFNIYKAKIFLGDAGALFLGFIVSFFGLSVLQKGDTVSHIVPILICGFLIFDATLVVFYRGINGKKVYEGSTDHTSHRLVNYGLSKLKAVILLYFLNIILGIISILVLKVDYPFNFIVVGIILVIAIALIFFLRKGFKYS